MLHDIDIQLSLFSPLLHKIEISLVTEKELRLMSILEIFHVEKHIPKSASRQWLGRKLSERETIPRSFVANAVYNHPFTRTTIDALHAMPNLRRICRFERISDIPSEAGR
jgi:hypothetical protein